MKNKELTALEALNLIYDKYVTDDEFLEDDKLFSIIEKALKEVSGEDKAFLRHVKTGKLHPLTTKYYQNLLEKQRALEIIKNCICGEFELIDNASTDNLFKTPYRFRIYMDEYTYNEWYLRNKEEYDLLKEALL